MSVNPLAHPICLAWPRRRTAVSWWHEHIPFAMFLVDLLRPRVLVELGVHAGDSYCAFCQAVEALTLETRCHGVDTWKGDAHAGFYDAAVLDDLRAHHDPLYGRFSTLLQSTFDDALLRFPDHTVDLLHIDGYHTYDAVKHDFEAWLPKLSGVGIVLLHDIHVHGHDFGVARLWEEIRTGYRSFDFPHGAGLGVLAVGDVLSPELAAMFDATPDDVETIRRFFFELGRRLSLSDDVEALRGELDATSQVFAAAPLRRPRRLGGASTATSCRTFCSCSGTTGPASRRRTPSPRPSSSTTRSATTCWPCRRTRGDHCVWTSAIVRATWRSIASTSARATTITRRSPSSGPPIRATPPRSG